MNPPKDPRRCRRRPSAPSSRPRDHFDPPACLVQRSTPHGEPELLADIVIRVLFDLFLAAIDQEAS